jgi:hypothetical protein
LKKGEQDIHFSIQLFIKEGCMTKKMLRGLCFLFAFCLLFFINCKTGEDAAQYTLIVSLGEGITGTPATGSFSYAEGDVVSYSYTVQAGYENLEVKLDGITVANAGVITMNMSHTLTVTADERFDPTGGWEGIIVQTGTDYQFDVTFSGDYAGGTTSGEIDTVVGAGTGTYSISGNTINFNLIFSAFEVECTGTIENNNNMSGEWSIPSYISGNWSLTRQ